MRSKHVSSLTDSNNIGKNGIGNIPFVKRSNSSKILCDFTGANLATLSVITKRLYLFPFQISKILKINRLRVNVTSQASNSVCSVGIYSNKRLVNGDDIPFELLDYVDTLLTTSTGDKTANKDFIFNKDVLYWIGVICGGAPTLRALTASSLNPCLGRVPNSTGIYTHFYKNLSNQILPQVVPTDLTISSGNIPAIYVLE